MSGSINGGSRIPYQPSLDGIRAAAVAMVLLFHGQVGWMRGGYFGVSMFFTLSGFLITSLLLRELDSSGRVSPKAFYARRLRRLLPASLLCLSAVCVLAFFDVWTGVEHLRRDVLGALFQVANWVQLAAGESYTDLQSRNAGIISPLDHYWSLAIEEQFYWVWPLGFWGLATWARRRGWALTPVTGVVTVVFAVAAPVIAIVWGSDAAYWATPARMGEILVGAFVAVALAAGRIRPHAWMAPIGALAAVALAVALPATGGPAYHGAFPALAVVTGLLVLGVQQPGPVAAVLALRPLVALGKISYGVYLYHFPIYVLMSPQRTDRSGMALLVMRLVVTLVVSVVSYLALERPIRTGHITVRRTMVGSGLATAGVCGLVLVVPVATSVYYQPDPDLVEAAAIQPVAPDQPAATGAVPSIAPPTTTTTDVATTDVATTDARSTSVTATSPAETISTSTTLPPLGRPARVLVVGDSTAKATGAGMVAWAAAHPDLMQVSLAAVSGCGFVRGGVVPTDGEVPFTRTCDELLDEQLPTDLITLQPDVVMMMVTSRDIVPRQWNEAEGLIDPSDSRYVARLRADYRTITELIVSTSPARVVWIRAPASDAYWLGEPHPFTDPVLLRIREGVIRDTIREHADRSQLLDLRTWMEATGIAFDHDARPDGLHFTVEAALDVTERWLAPNLLAAATENAAWQASEGAG